MAIEVKPNGKPLGHEITGVDLSKGVDAATAKEIGRIWDEHGVILFRNQTLTPHQQVEFSSYFGDLEIFPFAQFNLPDVTEILVISNVVENGQPIGMSDAGRYWHTDMWYIDNPPRGSLLYALEVPVENGRALGDTMFASGGAAYDALPEDVKGKIEGRKAVFSYKKYLATRRATAAQTVKKGETAQKAREEKTFPDIAHPIVNVHPRTGRKTLYLAEGVISRIEGLPQEESDRIVDMLEKHVVKEEFVYRHNWKVGDIVLWDNASTLHCAIPDFALPLRRRMHRTTVQQHSQARA